jgi:hypothetical protein
VARNKDNRVSIKVSARALQAIRAIQRPFEDRLIKAPGQHDVVDLWLDAFAASQNNSPVLDSFGAVPNLLADQNEALITSLESVAQQLSVAKAEITGAVIRLKKEGSKRDQSQPKEEVDAKPVVDNAAAAGEWAVVERVQKTVAELAGRTTGDRTGAAGSVGYAGETAGGDGKPRKARH